MKRIISLTESELIKAINRIVESYDDDKYDEEDYVEVFLHYFRPWVKKNHGDEIGEYPLSFLVKKYIAEFADANGIQPEEAIYSYRNNLTNATNIGRRIVKQGKHKLPSLRSQEKFTERFKKPLEFFIGELNLPDFIQININEDNPYNVKIQLKVDWVGLIKYQGDVDIFKPDKIRQQLETRIKDFLGIELGNPTHGELNFTLKKEYIGVDEWVKKTLNKEIKKKIRELPSSRILHAIKFETISYNLGGELKFSFKNWNGRNDFMKDVKELLQRMGYNTKILRAYS
jgi:hypothetical protein